MAADSEGGVMSHLEPETVFEIEPYISYSPELQRLVAGCRQRANDDFIQYAIDRLRSHGSIAPDWPVRIHIRIQCDAVTWALESWNGHRFSASVLNNSNSTCDIHCS